LFAVSDSNQSGGLPPDLPPEYAEAYRRGYERAYRQAAGEAPGEDDRADAPEPDAPEPTVSLDSLDDAFSRATGSTYDRPSHRTSPERPAWLAPAVLAGLVVLLLGTAFGLGKVFSDKVSDTDVSEQPPSGIALSEDGGTPEPSAGPTNEPRPGSYTGPTRAAAIGGASGSCQAPDSRDAAGHRVGYQAANVYDGDMSTAWRCNGDGAGEVLTLELADRTAIGEVGLVPGYAKTDPRSGVDRYAENNRITKVRWTFDDGTSVEQNLDGSPDNRDLQTVRVPVTDSAQVTVEVLGSTPGSRNTVAVSEVRIGEALGR
jgi:hypothetical protein